MILLLAVAWHQAQPPLIWGIYAPKEVPLGDAPKEVPLGDAPKEVPLGDAPKVSIPLEGKVPFGDKGAPPPCSTS
jgi:hypothetical protein